MLQRFALCMFSMAMLLLSIDRGNAATLVVNQGSGPYFTVNAALTAANPGDVIEITDNTTTYTENLYVTKDNITIQGQAALNPRPVIQGVWQTHPFAGVTTGPQLWYWTPGTTNTASKIFDDKGAAVINAASGLTLRHLKVKCEPTSSTTGSTTTGLLDFRYGTNGLVDDCYLDGSGVSATGAEVAGAERAILTANNHTFQNCYFYRGNAALEHQGGTGTLTVRDSVVTASQYCVYIYGGNALLENVQMGYQRPATPSTFNNQMTVEIGNAYGNVNAVVRGCSFQKLAAGSTGELFGRFYMHDRGGAAGTDTYASGRWSTGTIECAYDNCDFIGWGFNIHTRAFDMGGGSGRINWILKSFRVTDCNFYNIAGPIYNAGGDVPFPGNQYQLTGTQDIFEDYNCYRLCHNTAILTGVSSGGHSVNCDLGQPMFVDPAGKDYRLAANSPGATLNSTGTPAYTGSYGVSGVTVPVIERTIAPSGGDFTSVQAAISAARDGEVLTITDNSAPYVGAVDFCTGKTGVTLRAAPSLNPRPVIKAPTGVPKPFAFVTKPPTVPVTHNMLFRDLVFDGTDTAGTNSTVFENFSTQTVMRMENCKVQAGATTLYGLNLEDNSTILENVDVVKPAAGTTTAFLKRKSRNVAMTSCTIVSGDRAIHHYGGKLLANKCVFVGGNANAVLVDFGSTTNSTTEMLEFYDTIIRSLATAAGNSLIRYNYTTTLHRRNLLLDNCDLVGSLNGWPSFKPTTMAIDINTTMVSNSIKDTIFYNFSGAAIDLHAFTLPYSIPGQTFDPTLGFEDYNVYKDVANTLDTQGCVRGTHDVYLTIADPLYSNPAAGDFRVGASTPAATLNSTGTPAYAGSQGIGPDPVSAVQADWAMFQ